jgi:two-component system sensor histidine kinase KdpD
MEKADLKLGREHKRMASSEVRARASDSTSAAFGYASAIVMTALATLVAFGLDSGMKIPNLSLVYVIPVIVAGTTFGLGPSLLAAVLSALSYNFFFTEPRFSLRVADPANIWAIALLLVVGAIVSTIAHNARRRRADATILKKHINALQHYSQTVAVAADAREAVAITCQALAAIFKVPAAVILLKDGDVVFQKAVGNRQPGSGEMEAMRAAVDTDSIVRARTFPALDSGFDFWPIRGSSAERAVIGLSFPADSRPVMQDEVVDIIRFCLALTLETLDRPKTSIPPR